jgi:hypothetical protein
MMQELAQIRVLLNRVPPGLESESGGAIGRVAAIALEVAGIASQARTEEVVRH